MNRAIYIQHNIKKNKKFSAGGLSDHEYERGLVLEFERTRLRPLGSNGLT